MIKILITGGAGNVGGALARKLVDNPNYFVVIADNLSTGSKEIGTMAAIAVGSVILLEAMFAGPMTKASMNPVRSIAPALFSGHLKDLWLYILAPILGSQLAIICHMFMKKSVTENS